jgi:hypothetical protein
MANQGCPYEGSDTRLFGSIVCFIERLGTFTSNVHPVMVLFDFPLGMRIFIPWFGGKTIFFRVAVWRYDWNAKAYIFFTGAFKKVSRPYPLYL